jgi:hypothetical protein
MPQTSNQEDLFVKWLISEAINYRNSGRPIHTRYALKWATRTRMHKIIFGIIEKFNLPVTRCWYRWGGFVHSFILDSAYPTIRHDYSFHPQRALSMRKQVRAFGVDVESVLEELGKRVDLVQSMPSNQFLIVHYKKETPSEYRNLYLSKQCLTNLFDDITKLQTKSNLEKLSYSVSISISQFSENTLELFDDEPHMYTDLVFSDLVENALDKLTLMKMANNRISKQKFSFFKEAKRVFDNFIWSSYACEISQRTAKGPQAVNLKQLMESQKQRIIKRINPELKSLKKNFEETNLALSFEELKRLKELTFRDNETTKLARADEQRRSFVLSS